VKTGDLVQFVVDDGDDHENQGKVGIVIAAATIDDIKNFIVLFSDGTQGIHTFPEHFNVINV
jgi:hypothetical protein